MSRSKKPRKAYRPGRWVRGHGVVIGARAMDEQHIAHVLGALQAGITDLREGRSTEDTMATVNTMLMLIEVTQKERLIANAEQLVHTGRAAAVCICDRAFGGHHKPHAWRAPTLYATEILTLGDLYEACELILRNIDSQEFLRIAKRFEAWARSARMGIIEYEQQRQPTRKRTSA